MKTSFRYWWERGLLHVHLDGRRAIVDPVPGNYGVVFHYHHQAQGARRYQLTLRPLPLPTLPNGGVGYGTNSQNTQYTVQFDGQRLTLIA